MRVDLQEAFVLHTRAYRETSLLVEALTPEHGRVGLVARGARSARSKLRGELQAFRPLLLSWSMRGELGTLTGAESQRGALLITGGVLASGLYINELVMRLLPRDDPHPALFGAYRNALEDLESGRGAPALRLFELRLLGELGYGLSLTHEAETGAPVEPGSWYRFVPEHGPVLTRPDRQDADTVPGRCLLAMAGETLDDPEIARAAKRITRRALAHYLGERPLRSRQLLRPR